MNQLRTTAVPEPRFAIGEKVFIYGITQKRGRHRCPDCLGTGEWPLTTPGGSEVTVSCGRCSWSSSDIPSLDFSEWTPYVEELTIGSIKIDTAPMHRDEHISYMCEETGIGSGSVYYESRIAPTREEAECRGQLEADSRNAEESKSPVRLEKKHLSHVTLKDAEIQHARTESRRARGFYDRIRDLVNTDEEDEEFIKDEDIREELRGWIRVYNDIYDYDDIAEVS